MASGCLARHVQRIDKTDGIIASWWRSICACCASEASLSSLIDMADQGALQTAKESNLKGFRNRLKKVFGRGTPPSRSTSLAVVAPPAEVVAPPPTVAAPPTVTAPPVVAVPPADALPPADLPPTVSTITTDPKEAAKLRAKYTHFRILVIGRANAGKTTLLKRVCNTEEDPVYSEVRYLLRFLPHSHHPIIDRLNRPRR